MRLFKLFILFVCVLTVNNLHGQEDIHEKLIAYETASLDEKMGLFFYFAPIFDLEKKDSILFYVDDLLNEGLNNNRLDAVALSNYGIATFLMNNSLFDEAYSKLKKAEKYYLNNDNDTMLAMVYIDYGNTAFLQGNVSKAEMYYKRSAKYAGRSGDFRYEILSMFNLARIFMNQGKYDVSKGMIQTYIKNVKSEGNLVKLASAYGLMGQLYLNQNNIEKGIEYFTLSMEAGLTTGKVRAVANGYTNLAIAEYFSGEFDKSEEYFRLALDYRLKEGNKYYIAEGYYNLGDFYFGRGQLDSSILNHSISLDVAENSNNLQGQKDALIELALLYDTLNQQKNQISILEKIIAVQKEIAKNQSYKEINTLKMSHYQSEKEALNSFGIREENLSGQVSDYEKLFSKWTWIITSGILIFGVVIYVFRRSH